MKSKTLTILVAVLVVLAALKYMQTVRHRASLRQTGLESLVADLQATDMGRLVITGPSGKDVVLARSGSDWVLESSFGHPASASNIERLLGSLSGLKGEFRSDKEEVLADYGLDDAQAIRLRVYDLSGKEQGKLLLGKQVPGGSGFFVRREGERKAFAAQGNLLGSLGVWGENREPAGKRFLDLKVFEADRQAVDSLVLQNGETRMVLAKEFTKTAADTLDRAQYAWRLNGKEASKSAADGVLGALASIYARDLLDPAGSYDFSGKRQRADVVLSDGERKTVEFGAAVSQPEEGLPMRIAGKDYIYLVPTNLTERIFKSRDDFKPEKKG